jgi:hypothetical protein
MTDDQSTTTVKTIPTEYAGHKFRSRLEARWAVFFTHMGIPWQYEPEGYELPSGRYVPDFVIPTCGTFIEVRGDVDRVDLDNLARKAAELPRLPQKGGERGPKLMLLGPIPHNIPDRGDLGWVSFYDDHDDRGYAGFGTYHKNSRPWWLNGITEDPELPLEPYHDPWECPEALPCYQQAAATRFWDPK